MLPLRTKCSATRPCPAPRANSIEVIRALPDQISYQKSEMKNCTTVAETDLVSPQHKNFTCYKNQKEEYSCSIINNYPGMNTCNHVMYK
jgi:hypothetical protein